MIRNRILAWIGWVEVRTAMLERLCFEVKQAYFSDSKFHLEYNFGRVINFSHLSVLCVKCAYFMTALLRHCAWVSDWGGRAQNLKDFERRATKVNTTCSGCDLTKRLYEANISSQNDRNLEEILFIIFEISILGT